MSAFADAPAVKGSPDAMTGGRTRFVDRTFQATAASGVIVLTALAIALEAGPGILIIGLTAIGLGLTIAVLARPTMTLVRAHRELILLVVPIAGFVIWVVTAVGRLQTAVQVINSLVGSGALSPWGQVPQLITWPLVSWPWPVGQVAFLPLVEVALAAAGGLVLVADAARVRLGLAPRQRTPWKHLTAPDAGPPSFAWRAVAGVLLIGAAAALAINEATSAIQSTPWQPVPAWKQTLLLVLIATGAGAVIGMPLLIGSRLRFDRDKGAVAREHERQRFAAHLHDSVLQTLALVQRQAHDPAAVTRLARRQEHALRAWMAGETELRSDTLVSALRDAVAEVEDDEGLSVELTAIGDRPIDGAGESLVAATREALRNAARHAPGASIVIFAEISRDGAEVFVRDDGPGFTLEAVAPERRGIRDAIIGRMVSAGGSASVESAPGEGTEVALRLNAGNGRK
jgi:signal transduction histidine kinase